MRSLKNPKYMQIALYVFLTAIAIILFTILCGLCNLSYVYDSGFDWDPVKNTFANGTGDPAWLKRAVYRNGWEIKL